MSAQNDPFEKVNEGLVTLKSNIETKSKECAGFVNDRKGMYNELVRSINRSINIAKGTKKYNDMNRRELIELTEKIAGELLKVHKILEIYEEKYGVQ